MKAIAIDPPGCGCTECMIGLYVPLDRVSEKQILKMLLGKLANHTGTPFTLKAEYGDHEWYFPA